ncbi:MAG: hypothetical protein HFI84_03360 [Eubacterium sp.]|nr:hypothetical protein [Eubacterium sp.]
MMATSWEWILRFPVAIFICPAIQRLFRESRVRGGQAARGKTSHPAGPALDRAGKKCKTAASDGENLWLFQGSSPSGIYHGHFFSVLSRVASGCQKEKGQHKNRKQAAVTGRRNPPLSNIET